MKEKTEFPFWKNKNLTPEECNAVLVEICQRVFSTDDGKVVLNMLLTDLFLFKSARTEEEQGLSNYAKFFIRERLGVSDTKALTDFIAQTAAFEGGK